MVAGDRDLARSTAVMTALTAVSRITGFARIVVVAAVLGTTFLGNTYQSANTIPNLLFELFAAGALQAVLIPTLVEVVDRGDKREADHVAGSVLGLAALALGVVSAVGLLLSPWLMRGLMSGVSDPQIRDAQVDLGVFLLWFFLPQTVVYAAGLVATAALNAKERFALPVAAPIVNNVVVIISYALFHALRRGAAPSLDLTLSQKLVLAGGTTAGVVAFCAVPFIGALRAGFTLRPRLDVRHPLVRRLVRQGAWAAAQVGATQVLLAVVLVLANRIEGGVVSYQVGFTLFLLPHALFALPALTALFPRLSRQANDGEWAAFAGAVTRGLDAIAFFGLAAGAALVGLAEPMARVILFGAADDSVGAVAGALRGFGPGVAAYGAFLFLTRAFYARREARTPALVNVAVAASAGVAMVALFDAADTPTVGLLAGVHSAAYFAAVVVLFTILWHRGGASVAAVARSVAGSAVAALVAGAVMAGIVELIGVGGSRAAAAGVVALGGGGGVIALFAGRWALRPAGAPMLPELLVPRG